jgi:peptide/nickel transport system ATP-binding protein
VSGDLLLSARDVSVSYAGRRPTRAVRGVSFELRRGEVLGIAGESGCGKSTLAYALARLLRPPAQMTSGTVEFFSADGSSTDLALATEQELRRLRSAKIAMVFQSSMNALNPVATIGRQFGDILNAHQPGLRRGDRLARARELLELVGIDPNRVRSFPHELSGGMRQRVAIAMALALRPELVIMDEPTTALDVVVQQEILDEVDRLRTELGFSVIFITHDLSLLLEISDRIAIMYAGQFVEYGPAVAMSPAEVPAAGGLPSGLPAAAHPYTQGLLGSFPDLRGERRELHGIPGSPPDLRQDFAGCPFLPRCGQSVDGVCDTAVPPLRPVPGSAGDWLAACHLVDPSLRPTSADTAGAA